MPDRLDHFAIQRFVDEGLLNCDSHTFFADKKRMKSGYEDIQINGVIRGVDRPGNLLLLLDKYVRMALKNDEPIGFCLSGGLDSTSLVKLAARYGPVTTISTEFPGTGVDESAYIKAAINDWRINNVRFTPPPPSESDIKNLVMIHNGPIAGLSIWVQYCVMSMADDMGISTLIDGQGPDELLCGYIGYQRAYISDLIHQGHWLLGIKEAVCSFWYHWRVLLKALRSPETTSQFKGTLADLMKRDMAYTSIPAEIETLHRNAEVFGLKVISPYLEYEVMDYMAGLTHDQRIRNGTTKWILREAMKGILPESIRTRQLKLGFPAPEETWMKNDLMGLVCRTFDSAEFKARPYWDAKKVTDEYLEFLAGNRPYNRMFWRVFCTEVWLRSRGY